MPDDALIERFDRHLVRIDEELRLFRETAERLTATADRQTDAFDRQASAFDRQAGAFDRQAEVLDRQAGALDRHTETSKRHAAMFEDTREFIREMTLRVHRGGQAMVEALNANTRVLHEELADGRGQIRANTAAILRVLDRLEEQDRRRDGGHD